MSDEPILNLRDNVPTSDYDALMRRAIAAESRVKTLEAELEEARKVVEEVKAGLDCYTPQSVRDAISAYDAAK